MYECILYMVWGFIHIYINIYISVLFLWYEVVQTPIVPTPATLPFLSQPAPMASWGVPYNQLTEEEKTQDWFTDGSAWYVGIPQKWIATALQPFLVHPIGQW